MTSVLINFNYVKLNNKVHFKKLSFSGMPFWLNFIFRGARVGGLRERRQLDLETGRLGHLDNAPDSNMGKAEIEREKRLLKAVHLRSDSNCISVYVVSYKINAKSLLYSVVLKLVYVRQYENPSLF